MQARAHIFVAGKVQGVYFRSWVEDRAAELGLTGWVRNTEDGNVEIVAEGEKPKLERFVGKVKLGPPAARVKKMDVSWQPAKNEFKTFEVKYEWL